VTAIPLMAVFGFATVAMLIVAVTSLAWMVDSWRTPHALGQMPFPEPDEPRLSFTRRLCSATPSAGC
jgi:hypothetical protein